MGTRRAILWHPSAGALSRYSRDPLCTAPSHPVQSLKSLGVGGKKFCLDLQLPYPLSPSMLSWESKGKKGGFDFYFALSLPPHSPYTLFSSTFFGKRWVGENQKSMYYNRLIFISTRQRLPILITSTQWSFFAFFLNNLIFSPAGIQPSS